MQTREMWKSGKWKLVAGAATLSALGIGGMAVADSEQPDLPDAINLKDHLTTRSTLTPIPDFVVNSGNEVDLTHLDSPFTDGLEESDTSLTDDTSSEPDTQSGPSPTSSNARVIPDPTISDDSSASPTTTQAQPPNDDSVESADSVGDGDDTASS